LGCLTLEGPAQVNARDSLPPHTEVVTLGQTLTGFLDTGSEPCGINDRYRRFVPKSAIITCHVIFKSASGRFVCSKMCDIIVQLGHIKAKHRFYFMKNLPKQILFGRDFMRKHNISIHLGDQTWSADGM
jgi:hypothetical protein